jgi:peroxiredoxin
MRFFTTAIFCLLYLFSTAQQGYNIDIELENYNNDTLLVGYYYGDRQLVKDTLITDNPGKFSFVGQDTLDPGMYILVTKPDNSFIQFMVPTNDQHFKIMGDAMIVEDIAFEGSVDNDLLTDYVKYISEKRKLTEKLDADVEMGISTLNTEEIGAEKTKIDTEVKAYIAKIMSEHPETVTALLLKSNIGIDVPEYEGTAEEVQINKYLYYKLHYFDNIEMDNPAALRTPFLHNRVDYYMEKLTVQHPDSIKLGIDYVLEKVEPAPKTFQFYLSHFLNKYANSKVVGFDAIYVHLVDNYYAVGKAPWMDEETLLKIKDNADDLRPVLIGNIAPDITVYEEDNKPISLSDIDADYTVLYFWAPDCGHCKKSIPKVVEFNEQYKDKGVKVFAICTKHREKTKGCWEALKERNMLGFINAADENHKSRFKIKFNVKTTPKIFILNRDREILMKNIGSEQLSKVMDNILSTNKKKEFKD